jgi:hypothetical protein
LTVDRELFSRMPYYTAGPEREDGSLAMSHDLAPLTLREFVAELLARVAVRLRRQVNERSPRTGDLDVASG